MANALDALKTGIAAAQAKTQLEIGPQADPQQVFFNFFGFKFRPGETVVDTVSGGEAVILGGSVETINPATPGVVIDSGSVGEAS